MTPAATSPFLAGTSLQYAWDSVSIGNALACWRRYQLLHIEGWSPRGGKEAIALIFGILFHSGVEQYHRARADGEVHDIAVWEACKHLLLDPLLPRLPTPEMVAEQKETTPEDDDGIDLRNSKIRTRYHLFRALVWYLDTYEKDPAKTLLTADGRPMVEYSFRIPLPIESPTGDPFILAGHIDRMVEWQNRLWVKDYKSTKSLSSQFFSSWQLSHQLTGYYYAGQVIAERPVAGVIIDGVALQVGGVKLGRAPTTRTTGQLNEYFENLRWLFSQAEILAARLSEDPDFQYPMNTSSCYFCAFKGVCSQPPEYRRKYLGMEFERVKPWNPLESR